MKFRKAIFGDIPKLVKLFEEYRVFYGEEPNLELATNFIEHRIKNGESVVFICENKDNQIIGFAQLYPLFSSTRLKKIWLLNDLFVDENFRGLGISKELLDCAKDLCRETGACELTLETQRNNVIANRLYKKTDFSLDIEHNFYAWSG
ncbi:GNAT family N-acetyltransferase [Flagellimonas aquimarina]|uniref:GNAT family N-acetyltransferase n=1 Tax=Flagellimonas aquimarina TaxID=2201895 RepID=A0A316L5C9_9FLAO|nr:GNAT family N-acetyltransferase [Allomuricauda koreensis]PWL39473.1 GNAT family N-acetyltransferase [Allomuricauda koreensis]